MNHSSFDAIRNLLAKERAAVASAVEATCKTLSALESNLQRIDAATAALDGESSRRKPIKDRTRSPLPSIGKAEVIRYMETLLTRESLISETTLKAQVEALAKANGYSRLGIGMRFKDALNDSKFAVTSKGVELTL